MEENCTIIDNEILLIWLTVSVTPSPGCGPGASPHLGESHSSFRSVGPWAPIIGLHCSDGWGLPLLGGTPPRRL